MAILEPNLNRGFIGKVGNTVTYVLNGQVVKRTIGLCLKEPTINQLAVRQQTRIIAEFLNPVKEYINTGFELVALNTIKNQHNLAASYNRLNAITGTYPDQHIDFSRVLFSRGKLPVTRNINVKLTGNRLDFKWDATCMTEKMKSSDRVMLLAYLPDQKYAVYLAGGEERLEGAGHLIIPGYVKGMLLETYVSFIAADRKSISDSVYTGQIF
ncbi:DUF6266 family protein [Pedobacter lusitanus]|uniref:DUF6266 family protein n=1 Tax=Pedobacter lusitanus TaxID=1503925 RepID=UPI0006982F9B|nr:DUF6266 family protein [Pedobacter lusitanus]